MLQNIKYQCQGALTTKFLYLNSFHYNTVTVSCSVWPFAETSLYTCIRIYRSKNATFNSLQ